MNYTEMEAKVFQSTPAGPEAIYLTGSTGARGNEQRALGSFVVADAGNRQRHLQLVRANRLILRDLWNRPLANTWTSKQPNAQ